MDQSKRLTHKFSNHISNYLLNVDLQDILVKDNHAFISFQAFKFY